MNDLKQRTIRGGLVRICAQAANFGIRIISLMLLARLLDPADFGLVGMVTAFTSVLGLFRDFGLSSAAVQRETVSDEQVSTLFWINLAAGVILCLLAMAMAPLIAAFYHEPRLVAVTFVLALAFFLNAAGAQHTVLLMRQMRFTALALIGVSSLIVSTVVGIAGAKAGYGYWALVAMTISFPAVNTAGLWLATSWVPGMPVRGVGIRSMMRYGGIVTLNGLIIYLASNFEKILLGRFWGADAIGIYGRAYQLINIPTDNLNSAAGEVAFSALSRLQNDPIRLKSYFLKGYSLILIMTLPLTTACLLFPEDIIQILLGPKWKAAVPILRLLAPTIFVFAIANPLSWLVTATGHVGRLLKMGLVITPIMIASYFVGLPYGPKGVAFAYSAVMVLWLVPLIIWITRGTVINTRDVLATLSGPLLCAVLAGGLAFATRLAYARFFATLPRLILETAVLFGVFLGLLLFVPGQKSFYIRLIQELKGASSVESGSKIA